MDPIEAIKSLGPAAGVVVVVFLFLKALAARDQHYATFSTLRDERMIKVIDRNTEALQRGAEVSGEMLQAMRIANGKGG